MLFVQYSRLHGIHGNRWVTIGKAIGVSGRAAQDKYRSMAKRRKKGEKSHIFVVTNLPKTQ